MSLPSHATKALAQTEAEVRRLRRALAVAKARDNQIEFVKLLMPDPNGEAAGDPLASRFDATAFHYYLAGQMAEVAKGQCNYKAITTPPQHGKTTLTAETFIPWLIGKMPHLNVIYGTYSDDRGREVGGIVKGHIDSDVFREVFPGVELRADSKASDQMVTNKGGRIAFIGRKGAGTGKPCDLLLVDDPLKNAEEARSTAVVRELHDWWDTVADTRCHKNTRRLVIHTRWIVDDLIGVLCDPEHPDYDAVLAADWDYINIPAVVKDPALARDIGLTLAPPGAQVTDPRDLAMVIEQFGEEPMSALWPARFDLPFMARRKRKNRRVFEAMSMGNPTPEDGEDFTKEMIVSYRSPADLPVGMLYYGSSDHAISEKREADYAVIGCVGVDGNDNIWVLPDLLWDRVGPDGVVEGIVNKVHIHKPVTWFAETDLIGATLGPSIRQRMEERRAYAFLEGVSVKGGDKKAKAANARARMSLGKIRLPAFAPWYDKAVAELLKFPTGRHDDFVDFLSILCRGLDNIHGSKSHAKTPAKAPEPDTIGYLMYAAKKADRLKSREKNAI